MLKNKYCIMIISLLFSLNILANTPAISQQSNMDQTCKANCGAGGAVITVGCAAAAAIFNFGASSSICTAGLGVMEACIKNCQKNPPNTCKRVSPTPATKWRSIYSVGDNGPAAPNGFKNYDLLHHSDRIIPLNFNGDKHEDFLVYRPGSGAIAIFKSLANNSFEQVYFEGSPGNGIAGFDLRHVIDRILPFDFDGDNKDDLILYRPGAGAIYILKSQGNGSFQQVYAQGSGGSGIGGFDLKSARDIIVPFDYDGDNKDDLILYRPGAGAIYILKSQGNGSFQQVYAQGSGGSGIGGFDLKGANDGLLVGKFNGDNKDDLLLYRPGKGAIAVLLSKGNGSFDRSYFQGAPGNGIGGFDLKSGLDRLVLLDYNNDGLEDIFGYRRNRGAAFLMSSNGDGTFTQTYGVGDNGCDTPNGLAGYDLLSPLDDVIPIDFSGDGKKDIIFYRPGTGAIYLVKAP